VAFIGGVEMKTFCFYHSADLDGHCSGAIVKYKYPDAIMRPINYGDEFPWDEVKGHRVIMVDFSLQPFTLMEDLLFGCQELIWIDHHISAIKEHLLSKISINGVRNAQKAACELTWKYFFPYDRTPKAVYLLGRYDVWDHSDPDTLPFQYGMRLRDLEPSKNSNDVKLTGKDPIGCMEFWKNLFTGHEPFDFIKLVQLVINDGRLALIYQTKQNKIIANSSCFETELDGLKLIAANVGLNNSKLFDSVWDPNKYAAMASFHYRKGNWTISLYSDRDDVDVSEICKARGGGGHKGAAGFQCSELPEGFLR
jgi:oligoribonuclease NrnB/cAMP/cGMP phosphodiesterase (DHH superfamily)